MFVNADSSSTIQAYAEDDGSIDFYLAGYWSTSPGTYTETFNGIGSPSSDATWDDVDLSSYGVPADAVVENVISNQQGNRENEMGFRQTDSSLARYLDLCQAQGGGGDLGRMHTIADGSSTVSFYMEDISDSHNFFLAGYWVPDDKVVIGKGEDAYELQIDKDLNVSGYFNGQVHVSALITPGWHSLVLTYDSDEGGAEEIKLYIDGTQQDTADYSTPIATNSKDIAIGNKIEGSLDEIRLSSISRTAAWIETSYYSESNTLLTYGDEEELPVNNPPTLTGGTTTTNASTLDVLGGDFVTITADFVDLDDPGVDDFIVTIKVRDELGVEFTLVDAEHHGYGGLTITRVSANNYSASYDWDPGNGQPTYFYDLSFTVEDNASDSVEDTYANNTDELKLYAFGGISIDGNMADWTGPRVTILEEDLEDRDKETSFDIARIWAADDSPYLYFRIDTVGDQSSEAYRIYLDTDQTNSTGFTAGWMSGGAEYMMESGLLYTYTGSGTDWSWSFNGAISSSLDSTNKHRELSISRSSIGETNNPGEQTNIIFQVGSSPNEDYAPNDSSRYHYRYEYRTQALIVRSTDISPPVVEKNTNDIGMMRLEFYADTNPATVTSVRVNRTGLESVNGDVKSNGVSLFDDSGSEVGVFDSGDSVVAGATGTFSTSGSGGGGQVTLTPTSSFSIAANSTEIYYVVYDIAASTTGKTLGARLNESAISAGGATVVNDATTPGGSWIGYMPLNVNDGKRVCFYYGWPSSVNATYSIPGAVDVFDEFDVIIFAEVLAIDPGHGDKSNTQAIIDLLHAITTKDIEIYGQVLMNRTTGLAKSYADIFLNNGADDYDMDGIFWDLAGYDVGVSRSKMNTLVDYVHGKSGKNMVYSLNPDDALGDDYHAVYNPDQYTTSLGPGDSYVLKNMLMNNGTLVDDDVVIEKVTACYEYRKDLGVKVYGVDTGGNTVVQDQVDYGWNLTLAFGFDGYQYTDTNFSAMGWNDAKLIGYDQSHPSGTGNLYRNDGVNLNNETTEGWRRTLHGQFEVDFSSHDASFTTTVPGSITIDGTFTDWSNTVKSSDSNDMIDSNIDILDYYVTDDETDISFRIDVQGTICGASSGVNNYYIFIDTDQDTMTGYHGRYVDFNIGAEYMILVQGSSGSITSSTLYRYNQGFGMEWDWVSQGSVSASMGSGGDANKLETETSLISLDLEDGSSPLIFISAEETSGGTIDYIYNKGPAIEYHTLIPEFSGIFFPILAIFTLLFAHSRSSRCGTTNNNGMAPPPPRRRMKNYRSMHQETTTETRSDRGIP